MINPTSIENELYDLVAADDSFKKSLAFLADTNFLLIHAVYRCAWNVYGQSQVVDSTIIY